MILPATIQRNLCCIIVSFLSTSGPIFATTLPWQGCYGSVYLGGGFGNNHLSTNAGSVTSTSYFSTETDTNAVNNAGSWTKHPGMVLGGIQAGQDWVAAHAIYGVVLDYGSLSLNSSDTTNNIYPDDATQYTVYTAMQTNWLFTLRGRLGYQKTILTLPSLLYATGGMAMTRLSVSNNYTDNSSLLGMGSNTTSQNQLGWTVGAGIEMAVFDRVSVNVEYLYVDVPSVTTISSVSNTQGGFGISEQSTTSLLSTTANFAANVFKIGLNYRFDE